MRSTYQVQIVFFTEKLDIIRAKSVAYSSLVLAPTLSVFVGVAP
jgi:hypothetical protein